MLSWLFVFYTLGPSLLVYSLMFVLRHPESLNELFLAVPLSLMLTCGGYWLANRYLRQPRAHQLAALRGPLITAGWLTALILGLVFYFLL